MILFKRVGESFRHIEDREWVLLFLETLGVLAGILIAFELQEWASNRAETAQNHRRLERLFGEAEDNVATLRDQRDVLARMVKDERAFAISLVHDGKCPPEPQWTAVENINKYPAFDVAQAVYQEMMGAGGLSTIDNAYVRQTISDFHSELDYYDNQNNFFRLKAVEPLPADDSRGTVHFDPKADDPTSDTYDRIALCADRAFRNKVANGVRNHEVLAQNAREELTGYAIKMCAAIGHELGRTCVPRWGGPLTGVDAKMALKAVRQMTETRTG
jgi:hypothetical protein